MEPLRLSRRAVCGGALALAATPAAARGPRILTGLDRLALEGPGSLGGKRVGLLTHDGAIAADRRRSVDVIADLAGVKLAALFAPEHGLAGGAAAGEHVGDGRDARTGVPVFSLYGARKVPEPAQLAGLDCLVIDLQDVGLRCYTYAGTALSAIDAALTARVGVLVLDRPNPLGRTVEGPLLDPALPITPVTALPVPYRHGLTLGELMRFMRPSIGVLPVRGWKPGEPVFGAGRLPFAPPSPNLRSLEAIWAYPATVLVEGTNLSEGRGTERPFQQIGAPWLDAAKIVAGLRRERLPGVRFDSAEFTPTASKHAGAVCRGVRLTVTDVATFRGFETGLALIATIRARHPGEFAFLPGKPPFFDLLAGSTWPRSQLLRGEPRAAILARAQASLANFDAFAGHARLY